MNIVKGRAILKHNQGEAQSAARWKSCYFVLFGTHQWDNRPVACANSDSRAFSKLRPCGKRDSIYYLVELSGLEVSIVVLSDLDIAVPQEFRYLVD
jgi:hypothetical protein